MSIPPFAALPAYQEAKEAIDAAIARVLASGTYIGGDEVAAFESSFADYCGAAHCVGTGNGLDALVLALRALEIGPGDEVVVASNSFIATILAISQVGATPVLVEPNPETHTIEPGAIAASITPRTRALLPTDLYGHPCDLDALLALCRDHGLSLIEDAAQAHGALYRGRRVGAHGDIACWSFYPTKNLGALGDAGAITTNDPELAERVRVLGNYGSKVRYYNQVKGVNSRLDPIQAAVLSAKLPYLDEWNERRREIADRYSRGLSGTPLILPRAASWATPVWHQYVVRSSQRDTLQERLARRGINTLIHYPRPPNLQQAYLDQFPSQPVAEQLADEVISLPLWPQMTDSEVDEVIGAIRDICEDLRA